MFAQQARVIEFDASELSVRTRAADPALIADQDDELAPARGFALGLLLGVISLSLVGGLVWWIT